MFEQKEYIKLINVMISESEDDYSGELIDFVVDSEHKNIFAAA